MNSVPCSPGPPACLPASFPPRWRGLGARPPPAWPLQPSPFPGPCPPRCWSSVVWSCCCWSLASGCCLGHLSLPSSCVLSLCFLPAFHSMSVPGSSWASLRSHVPVPFLRFASSLTTCCFERGEAVLYDFLFTVSESQAGRASPCSTVWDTRPFDDPATSQQGSML